jgi:hypothetical protein
MDNSGLRKILIGDYTIKRLVWMLVCSLIFVYVFLLLIGYFYSDRMIFLPQSPGYEDSAEIIKIPVEDGVTISAIYLLEPNSEFTILFSHGNAEDMGNLSGFLKLMQRQGYSVFAYDYRGYGTSGGRPSEKKTYKDIETVYEYMIEELNIPAGSIIAHGKSVGGGAATDLAVRKNLAGLILESIFVSAFRVSTRIRLLPFDKFENIAKIGKVECPVLVIHGKDDRMIDPWHSEKIFETANDPKLSYWVEGAGHNDLFYKAGNRYWEVIDEFTALILESK